MDIGGSEGAVASALKAADAGVRALSFDLPEVVNSAKVCDVLRCPSHLRYGEGYCPARCGFLAPCVNLRTHLRVCDEFPTPSVDPGESWCTF